MLWLAFNAPHTPWHLPPLELHSYGMLTGDPNDGVSDQTSHYHASIEALDAEIGRLLAHLETTGRDDVTVIFVGDNGSHGAVTEPPWAGNKGKGTLYQGGIWVPFCVRGPAVEVPGERVPAMVHVVDIFPTVLELAGLDGPFIADLAEELAEVRSTGGDLRALFEGVPGRPARWLAERYFAW